MCAAVVGAVVLGMKARLAGHAWGGALAVGAASLFGLALVALLVAVLGSHVLDVVRAVRDRARGAGPGPTLLDALGASAIVWTPVAGALALAWLFLPRGAWAGWALVGVSCVAAALPVAAQLIGGRRASGRPAVEGHDGLEPRSRLLAAYAVRHRDARVVPRGAGPEEVVRLVRGHEAAVRVADGPAGGDRVCFWVRVDGDQARPLDVTPGSLPPRLRQALRVNEPAQPDALAGLHLTDEVEAALRLLFGPFQANRLWLERGRLHVDTDLGADVVSAGWLEQVLEALIHLTSLLGEMRVVLRAAPREDARCPYCHEAVARAEATTCPSCATDHHAECWQEGGGCTILGCASRPRAPGQRAR